MDNYVDKLAEIGKLAHEMIQAELQGQVCDLTPYSREVVDKAHNSLDSFHNWTRQHTIKPILLEKPLVSERHRFGGTIDCYCLMDLDQARTLLDFKSGKQVYREHFIQVSAYRQLLEEGGYPVDQIRVLQIPRSEGEIFADHALIRPELYWQTFQHCLAIHGLFKLIGGGS
jgi:hypothetical protein